MVARLGRRTSTLKQADRIHTEAGALSQFLLRKGGGLAVAP